MQIILVSQHFKTAKTVTIMPRHVLVAAIVSLVLILATSATMSWLSVEFRLPLVQDLLSRLQHQESARSEAVLSNNLKLMAARVGELQAQVLQLDSLGERLAGMVGVRREQVVDKPAPGTVKPGQGGPLIPAPLTMQQLQQEIDKLSRQVDLKTDDLAMLEARLLEKKVRERLLPTTLPVKGATMGSGYGYRADPLVGERALHEGIDFNIETGTPVSAAAAGVVLTAEYRPDYGNLVEIDHGEGLVSRYAHLSRIDIKTGRLVKRGERIGLVGSTGRSTGPHLHFEVRMMGVAQNPAVFLRQDAEFAQVRSR